MLTLIRHSSGRSEAGLEARFDLRAARKAQGRSSGERKKAAGDVEPLEAAGLDGSEPIRIG